MRDGWFWKQRDLAQRAACYRRRSIGLLEDAQHWAAVYQELLIGLTGLRSGEAGSMHSGLRRSQLRCELRLRYWQAQIEQRSLSEEPADLVAESASASGKDYEPRSTIPSDVAGAGAGGRRQS
jgi:hypothetical protein